MAIWDINKIQEILPQRYPFLFIDSVVEVNIGEKKITCIKNLSITEQFFNGHFPGNPVMPGVLMIEAMAQASILLFAALKPDTAAKKPVYYLGKVEAKFFKPVKPGDSLLIEVKGDKILGNAGVVSACGKVGGEIVVEARIAFGVKID